MLINELFKIARVNFLLFPLIRKTWISKILNFKKTWTWIKIFINTRILKIFKFLIKFFSQSVKFNLFKKGKYCYNF